MYLIGNAKSLKDSVSIFHTLLETFRNLFEVQCEDDLEGDRVATSLCLAQTARNCFAKLRWCLRTFAKDDRPQCSSGLRDRLYCRRVDFGRTAKQTPSDLGGEESLDMGQVRVKFAMLNRSFEPKAKGNQTDDGNQNADRLLLGEVVLEAKDIRDANADRN